VDQDTHPSDTVQGQIKRWAWRTFFSRRYSKHFEQVNADIREIIKLKAGRPSTLGEFTVEISEDFFTKSQFNLDTANTKTFVLMLASEGPLNFGNGSPIELQPVLRNCNRKEFHHVYPRKFLAAKERNEDINSLVNFVILSKADNNRLGGIAPSEYRERMPSDGDKVREILGKALCPDIFHDNYSRFSAERATRLVQKARILMGFAPKPEHSPIE
jgi:hypothetical protein